MSIAASVALAEARTVSHRSQSGPGIVFERDGDLYALAVDASRTVRLTKTPVWSESQPAVSSDGRWIAYTRDRGGYAAIWLMSMDGRTKRRLTGGGAENWPAWSPDGRHVYYSRTVGRESETCGAISRKRADGKEAAEHVTSPRGFRSRFSPPCRPMAVGSPSPTQTCAREGRRSSPSRSLTVSGARRVTSCTYPATTTSRTCTRGRHPPGRPMEPVLPWSAASRRFT